MTLLDRLGLQARSAAVLAALACAAALLPARAGAADISASAPELERVYRLSAGSTFGAFESRGLTFAEGWTTTLQFGHRLTEGLPVFVVLEGSVHELSGPVRAAGLDLLVGAEWAPAAAGAFAPFLQAEAGVVAGLESAGCASGGPSPCDSYLAVSLFGAKATAGLEIGLNTDNPNWRLSLLLSASAVIPVGHGMTPYLSANAGLSFR